MLRSIIKLFDLNFTRFTVVVCGRFSDCNHIRMYADEMYFLLIVRSVGVVVIVRVVRMICILRCLIYVKPIVCLLRAYFFLCIFIAFKPTMLMLLRLQRIILVASQSLNLNAFHCYLVCSLFANTFGQFCWSWISTYITKYYYTSRKQRNEHRFICIHIYSSDSTYTNDLFLCETHFYLYSTLIIERPVELRKLKCLVFISFIFCLCLSLSFSLCIISV